MPSTFPKHGAIYAKELADDLLAQGFPEDRVFAPDTLTPDMLEPEKPVIGFDRIAAFFENAADLTGNDILGFERGQRRELRRTGLIAYVGVSSPTVLDFIKNINRYRRVFTDAFETDTSELETRGAVHWRFAVPASVLRRQYVEFGAAGFINDIRRAANSNIAPELVTFRHARNANTDKFGQYFGCRVEFGAAENAYYFNSADLAQPLVTADDELFRVLQNCCEHALQAKARNVAPLVVEVERMISDRLTKGEAVLEDVARAMGMSPRTLSRRLAEEGVSFFRILEDLRKSLAINYLRDSNLSLAEISYLLGYSGISSFSDAFKRWNGQTPGQYRAHLN